MRAPFQKTYKNERPIFIIGPGRSGTTLLQRIINTAPKTAVWGEHGALLGGIAQSYWHVFREGSEANRHLFHEDRLGMDARRAWCALKNPGRWQAWHNWFQETDLAIRYRGFITSLFKPGRAMQRWGFKEIRYGRTTTDVLEMLAALYPHSAFVLPIRDPVATIASQQVAFHKAQIDPQKRAAEWRRQIQNLYNFYENHPDMCRFIWHEDLITAPRYTIEALRDFLDLPLSPDMYTALPKLDSAGRRSSGKASLTGDELAAVQAETAPLTTQLRAFRYTG